MNRVSLKILSGVFFIGIGAIDAWFVSPSRKVVWIRSILSERV
jgi:hypothetical protein